MQARLTQIAVVYLTNRQNWWILGWMALMVLPSLSVFTSHSHSGGSRILAVNLLSFPIGACVFLLGTQSKWQFCNPRARLTPRYAGPHLLVLGLIALAFIVGLPVLCGQGGFNTVGCAAYSVVLAASFLWGTHAMSSAATFLALAHFFSLYSQRASDFWMSPQLASDNLPIHLTVLAAGWTAIGVWLRRLSQLREDMDDFFLPVQAQVGSATRMERAMAAQTIVRQLLRNAPSRWACDWWHDKLARVHAASTPARQRLLRYGFTPTPVLLMAIWMALLFSALLLYMSRTWADKAGGRAILPSMGMFILMPAIFPSGILALRRGRMPQELMFPMTRRQYVNGLFQAVALNAGTGGALTLLAMVALLTIVAPDVGTPSLIAAFAALTVGTQTYAFGAMTNTSRIQSAGKRNVMMMVALIPALIALNIGLSALTPPPSWEEEEQSIARSTARYQRSTGADDDQAATYEQTMRGARRDQWLREQPTPAIAWYVAAGSVVCGAALILDSRRRWLRLELV